MNYVMGTDKFNNIKIDKYENLINVLKTGDIFYVQVTIW